MGERGLRYCDISENCSSQNNILTHNERSLVSALFPTAKSIENKYCHFSCFWKPCFGYHEILYKAGESIFVADDNDQEIVVTIDAFCLCCGG